MCKREEHIGLTPLMVSVLISLLAGGCAETTRHVGGPSQYNAHYRNQFAALPSPTAADVRRVGEPWTVEKPFDQVWPRCVSIFSQQPAVLRYRKDGDARTVMLMALRHQKEAPRNRERRAVFREFPEAWLAVTVQPGPSPSTTRIWVAHVLPSGKLEGSSEDVLVMIQQISGYVNAGSSWPALVDTLSGLDVVERSDASGSGQAAGDDIEKLGGWISHQMRLSAVVVDSPNTIAALEYMLERLKAASGEKRLPNTRIFILASNRISAFAIPNGDIYVTTGLLDTLSHHPDQIAAVLAHELVHLLNRDVHRKLKTAARGRAGAGMLHFAGAVADMVLAVAGAYIGDGGLASQLSQAAIRESGEHTRRHFEDEFITGFAAETELQADEEGYELLVAAGYRKDAAYKMLDRFSGLEIKNNPALSYSNLLNMKPGIEERKKRLLELMDRDNSD